MPTIIQAEHPTLRAKAHPVSPQDIGSKKIQDILKRMREALASQPDGVAIAAPQIGEPLRIFLVAQSVLPKKDELPAEEIVCINPELLKLSKEKGLMEEGCLSVRWLYGKVPRARKATIRAYDAKGKLFTRGASGILAQVFQHECDHLEGVLFTDKARDLYELPETERPTAAA